MGNGERQSLTARGEFHVRRVQLPNVALRRLGRVLATSWIGEDELAVRNVARSPPDLGKHFIRRLRRCAGVLSSVDV